MAPIKKTTAPTGNVQPRPRPTETAPTNAPMQTSAVTAEGVQKKTAPTFNQNPTLKPNPPDNGSVNIIQDQRQPAPRGPQAPLGGTSYVNQQQPIDK